MSFLLILALVAIWIILGCCGFHYWWTKQFSFENEDMLTMFFVGVILGPFSWIVGKYIHS